MRGGVRPSGGGLQDQPSNCPALRGDKPSDTVWSCFGSCSVCFSGLFIRDVISCWRIWPFASSFWLCRGESRGRGSQSLSVTTDYLWHLGPVAQKWCRSASALHYLHQNH